MNNYTVVIPTAGLGSRLGKISEFINKSLLSFDYKPVLSHIIERFPDNTKFIIPVGYNKDQVKDFCELTYGDKNIEFIEIENYSESWTGPGYTVKQCLDKINSSFFYIPCDTYFNEGLKIDYAEDTYFVKKVDQNLHAEYTTFNIKDSRIAEYQFKTDTDKFWYAFTGVMFIKDHVSFKERLTNLSSPEIIYTIQPNSKTEILDTWLDFGNLTIYQAEVKKTQDYDFTKTDEVTYIVNNKVVKCWKDHSVSLKKYKKYLTNPKVYPDNVKQQGQFLVYDYCPGSTLYVKNDPNIFPNFLEWLDKKVWIKRHADINSDALNFYKDKTLKRIKMFIEKNKNLPTVTHVNDVPVKDHTHYIQNINFDMLCKDIIPSYTHGDLQFDNVITTSDNQFVAIDWRHEFGTSVEIGDLYYDLAKLYGGFVIDYSKIKTNTFEIIKKDTRVYLDIPHCDNYEYYISKLLEYIRDKNYNEDKVKLLVPVIFWNMSPLHTKPFDEFLWYLGILMFSKLESNETIH
jgi:NDP-sugar pyrophosphorylase family protein/thiamine kinase-like enzyme